jgi:hypothetical protein
MDSPFKPKLPLSGFGVAEGHRQKNTDDWDVTCTREATRGFQFRFQWKHGIPVCIYNKLKKNKQIYK